MTGYNWHNWAFPKWLSLNSSNSVNPDKIQDQFGYERHSISDNNYNPWGSGKKEFSNTDWYPFQVVTGYRYLPRGSNENALFIISTGNVSFSRWGITLVTIPFLDFVMIHWICWIQWNSFRKNSNMLDEFNDNRDSHTHTHTHTLTHTSTF